MWRTRARGTDWFVFKDGAPIGGPYRGIVDGGILFSPDSRRTVYGIMHAEDRFSLVTDGLVGPVFPTVFKRSWTFSPDSQHVAYGAGVDGSWHGDFFVGEAAVIVDGSLQRRWPHAQEEGLGPSIFFGPDSKRIAYIVVQNGRQFAVVDGIQGAASPGIGAGFSNFPNCHLYPGYQKAGWKSYAIEFTPDSSHHAYIAVDTDGAVLVYDGEPRWRFPIALSKGILFSPDSNRIAFGAEDHNGSQFLIIDGLPHKHFYGLPPCRPAFNPDPSRVAYLASDGQSQHLVVDDDTWTLPGRLHLGTAQKQVRSSRQLWDRL